MVERRPLIDGLKSPGGIDPSVEKDFVFGGRVKEPERPPERVAVLAPRAPISTRIRADFATALKRASLERQLSGQTPNTLQEILEEALEPWLRANQYLP